MAEKQVLKIDNKNKFPNGLISPIYASKRQWFLIKLLIKYRPKWSIGITKGSPICFFREIGYLDDDKTLIGLGRSWLPINRVSLKIILKCLFNKSPLGVIISDIFGSNLTFNVVTEQLMSKSLTPYRNKFEKTKMYHRVIRFEENIIAIIEEDFILKSGGIDE